MFNNFLSENRSVFKVMRKNMVETNISQMTVKQGTEMMRFECRITKTRMKNEHYNVYDIFVNNITEYFIARLQC